MMVVCQSHSCKLRVTHEDGSVRLMYFTSRKEKLEAKAFYTAHGFVCK